MLKRSTKLLAATATLLLFIVLAAYLTLYGGSHEESYEPLAAPRDDGEEDWNCVALLAEFDRVLEECKDRADVAVGQDARDAEIKDCEKQDELRRGLLPPACAVQQARPLAAAEEDCFGPEAQRAAVPASSRPTSVAKAFMAQFETMGYLRWHQLLTADVAGVDPSALDDDGRRLPRLDRLLPPTRRGTLGWNRQLALEAALAAPTLDGFITAAREDPAALRDRWNHLGLTALRRDDSALGHALRVRGSELLRRVRDIPAAAFGLHELAVAIEQGIDAEDFATLLDWSGVDAAGTWRHYTLRRRYNLAALAAVHSRPRILSALLAHGVTLPAGPPSVLDELALALSTTQPTPDTLRAVTRQLVTLGERPFLPSTASRLAQVAPDVDVPGLHRDAEAALALPEVRDRATQLAALVERDQAEAEEARHINDSCRDVWRAAGGARDLASKLAQQETLRERTQRTFQETTEQAHRAIAQLRPEFVDAASAMGPAIAAGDWQEALALLDDIGSKAPEEIAAALPEILLRSALYRGASREAMLALLERNGGTLPSDAIMTMAGGRWDDLDVAAELEAWGLDPRFVDADGRNAISQLMDDFSRPSGEDVLRTSRWLDYLTSRSVSPQPAGLGLDPLDTVLFAVLDAPEPNTVRAARMLARALVAAGAPVQASHRTIAARIRAVAPAAYTELVRAIPELG